MMKKNTLEKEAYATLHKEAQSGVYNSYRIELEFRQLVLNAGDDGEALNQIYNDYLSYVRETPRYTKGNLPKDFLPQNKVGGPHIQENRQTIPRTGTLRTYTTYYDKQKHGREEEFALDIPFGKEGSVNRINLYNKGEKFFSMSVLGNEVIFVEELRSGEWIKTEASKISAEKLSQLKKELLSPEKFLTPDWKKDTIIGHKKYKEKSPFKPAIIDKTVGKSSLKFDAVAYKKMQEKQNT